MTKLTSSHANRQSQERELLQAHKWGWAIGATSTQMCGGVRGEPIMLLKSTSSSWRLSFGKLFSISESGENMDTSTKYILTYSLTVVLGSELNTNRSTLLSHRSNSLIDSMRIFL